MNETNPYTSSNQSESSTPPPPAGGIEPVGEARTYAMLCHLTALTLLIGVPFGNLLGPLVVWLIKKNESRFVDEQGKESLNFQITVALAALICIPLTLIVVGVFLLLCVMIVSAIFVILAAVKTSNGEHYRYPVSLRLIK